MKKLKGVVTAEDFVRELQKWRRLWRRNSHKNPGARRHAKDLERKRIRTFKRLSGVSDLPRMQAAFSAAEVWNEALPKEVKLVFPYRPEDKRGTVADASKNARKRLKRIFRASIEKNSDRHIDLINAGGAAKKRLPSLADARFGDARSVRGLYLEAVGAAIIPHLSPRDVLALEAQGATVLDNEIIAVIDPLNESQSGAEESLWHLEKIEAQAARKKNLHGNGVLVGILDTGIDASHPEFAGKTIYYRAFDTTGNPRRETAKDYQHHGTHVSAICAGKTVGVAPEADLAVAAVLTERNDKGQMCGFLSQIAAGIDWLAIHAGPESKGVDIINASLGGPISGADDYYQTILGYRLQGKLMIAAIGNDGKSGMGTHGAPGRFECVLAVGASDVDDHVATFSAWGNTFEGDRPLDAFKPDLVAPGVNIYSALPRARYGENSGTSMACPVVSGAAALLIQQDSALRGDPDRLTDKLLTLTRDLPQQLHNKDRRCYGRGRLHLADI